MSEEGNISGEKPHDQTSSLSNSAGQAKAGNTEENISLQPLDENNQQQTETTEPTAPDLSSDAIEPVQTVQVTDNAKQGTLQPPTENMEVHHHPHTHHSKKWKDYLFEFLLLFLAVSVSFFVENQREYYIEHKRANQFSKQLLADLRLDSVLFENTNRDIQRMQKGYDTLLYMLIRKTGATDKQILETLLPIAYVFDIPATATTYNQMKTSGSLRYIEYPDLTAHLQQYYDVLLPRSIKIADASLRYYSENIHPFYLRHIRIQDYDPFNDTLINKNPLIMERSRQTDQELANIMGGYRSLLTIQVITMNQPALIKIKETIALIKKEYELQ
jgi:hypothetical protein